MDKMTLPLLATPSSSALPTWNGWNVVNAPSQDLENEAFPLEPQGAYGSPEFDPVVTLPWSAEKGATAVELLAPAGGRESALAAFHFGADAIYLGLKKFSARAEAENFTLEEVDEITAYAHSLSPTRRVFVAINTLIRHDELAELIECLAFLEDVGVDAVILQDLGVYHAIRRYFPRLHLHGSTQMAVHNRAGAEVLGQLGFQRVVLARELTFEEVHDVTATSGVETEVFIHGALCYAYSGLCLFSSQTLGRSGNRGKCAYSCRDSYHVEGAPLTLRDGSDVKRDPRTGFPFSMKDLALPDHLPALKAAGVACFKIEGRKKSPLYVATTTDYYRRLIDGRLSEEDRPDIEADLQTVFSRPWTRLFLQSHKDKEVADRDTVGHRGTLIGEVERVTPGPQTCIRFRTNRPLQRHDGLQIDLPVLGKPFGFAVDHLWIAGKTRREVIEAPAGSVVEVGLPREYPKIPAGAPVYCSSSQAVKQRYSYAKPKAGRWHARRPFDVEITLTRDVLTTTGRMELNGSGVEVTHTLTGPFASAHDLPAIEKAVRAAFERLGDSKLELRSLKYQNDGQCFVPVSRLNQLRRELVADLETRWLQARAALTARVQHEVTRECVTRAVTEEFRWSIKVDRIEFVDAFDADDWQGVDEVVIEIARDHPRLLREKLEILESKIGRERIRLALPALTRKWEEKPLLHKIEGLRAAGYTRWQAANVSAWSYLGIPLTPIPSPLSTGARGAELDISTDWHMYVINRLAAQQVLAMGAKQFTLSPEDGLNDWRPLLSEFGEQATLVVYQDTPQFIAESCAYANLIGGCPGKANCKFESMEMVSSHGEKVLALDDHCRTIVLNQGPFCLSTRLRDLAKAGAKHLRADFIYRKYAPDEVRRLWRLVRAGKAVLGGYVANCDRGML